MKKALAMIAVVFAVALIAPQNAEAYRGHHGYSRSYSYGYNYGHWGYRPYRHTHYDGCGHYGYNPYYGRRHSYGCRCSSYGWSYRFGC